MGQEGHAGTARDACTGSSPWLALARVYVILHITAAQDGQAQGEMEGVAGFRTLESRTEMLVWGTESEVARKGSSVAGIMPGKQRARSPCHYTRSTTVLYRSSSTRNFTSFRFYLSGTSSMVASSDW